MTTINLIKRFFTKSLKTFEEVFETVTWEYYDCQIRDDNNNILFEKRCEFPTTFSANARNIIASKYMYVDKDEEINEYSFKHVVTRVVKFISTAAVENQYMKKFEGDIFECELVYMLIHQMCAFNSPVWFNVGIPARHSGYKHVTKDVYSQNAPQASACFIASLEDSLDSIMELIQDSAQLFKYGSGVGSDWSKLRSSGDKLSGGGSPSGPVSFMGLQDKVAGTIKSGGKTRRAAIMQTLDIEHKDIVKFITCKYDEEKKAQALINAGYDSSYNGEAYGTVAFQNVNQSVRISDNFMQDVLKSSDKCYSEERELLRMVALRAHQCGDPGVQFLSTINKMHTCAASGPINSSNPCSEFVFLDDTSCNLASINLVKFLNYESAKIFKDIDFDIGGFKHVVDTLIVAQDVLVGASGYPNKKIAKKTNQYRSLGLGYSNLGALLMRLGLPYDSDSARQVASLITCLMHFTAYKKSAHIAKKLNSFECYEDNKDLMSDVLRAHASHMITNVPKKLTEETPLLVNRILAECGSLSWWLYSNSDKGFRNAQVTAIAPTGTISFMMDCDTTGIEPAISLTQYKKLAGKRDATIKITNNSVVACLQYLGYNETQIQATQNYIMDNNTVLGSPIHKEHYKIFECALGDNFITPDGHLKMLAACQPFVSGAISKTVNMPKESTVDDVYKIYCDAWKMGLKCVAIYRNNSKLSQPVTVSRDKKCNLCGDGNLVQTGTCLTCTHCGSSNSCS